MKLRTAINYFLLTNQVSIALALDSRNYRTQNAATIKWGPCENLETEGYDVQCGSLRVPLDYTNQTRPDETIDLELIKYPAKTQPAPKGSILLNFGGPGQDGVTNMIGYIPLQAPIIGDQFDIVSWNPRGTGNTLPFWCWDNGIYDGLLSDWWNQSDTTPGKLWAEGTVVSELCHSRLEDTGSYVGMASVARDMMQIVDALGEDGMLRYWGLSAGTVLGSTVAAMFPDRMDKVIIDGVLNPHDYYRSSVETEWFVNTDDVLKGILAACTSARPNCPLAADSNSTGAELETMVSALFDHLKYNPIPVPSPSGASFLLDYKTAMSLIVLGLYRPVAYPNVTKALDSIVRRDPVSFIEAFPSLSEPPPRPAPLAVYGIRCGDKQPRAESLAGLEPMVHVAERRSKWFSSYTLGPNAVLCAQWHFEANERYDGSFEGIRTRRPMLIIGNTFDPVTPLVSARNISLGFEGSVLLQQNGYGHTSITPGQESNCTHRVIHDYLSKGTLPERGTVCEPNYSLVDIFNGKYQPLDPSV